LSRARRRLALIAVGALAASGALPIISAHAVDPGRNGSVAFVIDNEETGGGGIYVQANDGTGVRTITSQGDNPTWSRDGKTIAFTIANSIYKVAATGGKVTRLTTSPRHCRDTAPRWSPTAASIIFLRSCTTAPYHTIYTVNANSKTLHMVTKDGAIDKRDMVGSADFLPSGKRVVFTAQCWAKGKCIAGNNRIVTANLKGGQRVSVTNDPTCDVNNEDCYPSDDVKASPDGKDFLYDFATNGPSCFAAVHNHKVGYCGGFSEDAFEPDWQPAH
jgi:Tol biopolymer transport system component